MATKTAKKNNTKKVRTINLQKISQRAKEVNNYTLEMTEDMVDGALYSGEKMQEITKKAVSGGLKLAAKQQDMMFSTLETLKGQLLKSASRFRGLFSQN